MDYQPASGLTQERILGADGVGIHLRSWKASGRRGWPRESSLGKAGI